MEQREKLIWMLSLLMNPQNAFVPTTAADYLLANGVVVLKDTSEPPCSTCNHGWVSASIDGIKSCHESCHKLKEYRKRKGGDE